MIHNHQELQQFYKILAHKYRLEILISTQHEIGIIELRIRKRGDQVYTILNSPIPRQPIPKSEVEKLILKTLDKVTRKGTEQEQQEVLASLQEYGVMFGSAALGVDTDSSDIDYAITKNVLEQLPFLQRQAHLDPSKYFRYGPEHGFVNLITKLEIQGNRYDILVLHNEEDLDTIRFAIQDLQQVPQYLLRRKELRIALYQQALQEHGWQRLRPQVREDTASSEVSFEPRLPPWSMQEADLARVREDFARQTPTPSLGELTFNQARGLVDAQTEQGMVPVASESRLPRRRLFY